LYLQSIIIVPFFTLIRN